MRDHVVKKLQELAIRDSSIMLLTGDLGFGVLEDFQSTLPDQFINAGVAEQNMTGVATGLGLIGKKVCTYSIGNFNTLRCLEQIRNDALYHNTTLVIISVGAGFSYGQLGYSHHATEDVAILSSLPNLKVYTPGCRQEAEFALMNAINEGGVSYLRIDKSMFTLSDNVVPNKKLLPYCLEKGHSAVAVVGYGGILQLPLKANKVRQSRLSVYSIPYIDLALNEKFLKEIDNYDEVYVLTEHLSLNGLAEKLKSKAYDCNLKVKIKDISLGHDIQYTVGDQSYLRNLYNINEPFFINL